MCTDALRARARRATAQTIAFLALAGALAPAALAGDVSPKAVRAAEGAAERVEREMRPDGARSSRVLGCWRSSGAVDCTGMVKGNDGSIKWRCMLQIRVRKRQGSTHRSKLTDAVCVAEALAESKRRSASA